MIQLTDNKIAVVPLEDPEKIGSIYVPEMAKQRSDQGIVKYIGPKVREIKIGYHVFYGGYVGTKVSLEGEGVLNIMKEDDVQLIFVESSEPLIPVREFTGMIDRAYGRMQTKLGRQVGSSPIDEFREHLYSEVQDHLMSRGFEF